MAINDTTLLTVKGSVFGQDHVHTLHFRSIDIGASEQDLIDAWQAGCRTSYRAIFSTGEFPCQTYTARQVCGSVPLRAPVEETETTPLSEGTKTGATGAMPPWIAGVVSVRTAFAGRSRRGRFYLGGMAESEQELAVITSGRLALQQAYIDDLISEFVFPAGAGGWTLVVHSHKLAAVPGTDCEDSSTLVTGFLNRSAVATMKSRKAGHGT
jgi:hypothetical protein